MTSYHCSNCHRPYPQEGLPHRCLHCGGIFSIAALDYDAEKIDASQPGLWRYQSTFGLSSKNRHVTLGEGGTPLVAAHLAGKEIHFKLEYQNPSGSYKDRGSTLLFSEMAARGIESADDDSSGNAGASFAAYAARANIQARVFAPESASRPKLAQIEAYGAELVQVPGPRSQSALAVLQAAEEGATYASHAYQPFGLAGIATIAYELMEQLGKVPGTVIAPAGHGSLLLGISMGFDALKAAGEISKVPQLIAVQASACAPLWAVANMGASGLGIVTEGETLAEGVRVTSPIRGDELLIAIQNSEGNILIVDEEKIISGRNALARLGFYVEATSAIVWDALQQSANDITEPIVAILTGSGLKSTFSPEAME